MNISVKIDDAAVKASLQKAVNALVNMKPLMERIGAGYEKSVRDNFRSQSSPDGAKWVPLSGVTMALGLIRGKGLKKDYNLNAKGRKYMASKRKLVDSGDLLGHIHFQADSNQVTIGTGPEKYAAIHQFGGMSGRGKKTFIPARPYLAVNRGMDANVMSLADKDSRMIVDLINEYLTSAIG